MPTKKTIRKAKAALKRGKRPTTAAGEFVHEEIQHIRRGKHGARSTEQVIAIGLSKARRAGVPLRPRKKPHTRGSIRAQWRDYKAGRHRLKTAKSGRRSRGVRRALERESRAAASSRALSRHAHQVARSRGRRGRLRHRHG